MEYTRLNLFRNLLTTNFIIYFIGFLFGILNIRLLISIIGINGFGIYSYIMAFSIWMTTWSSFGLSSVTFLYTIDKKDRKGEISSLITFTFLLMTGILFILLLIAFSNFDIKYFYFIRTYKTKKILLFLTLNSLLSNYNLILSSLTRALENVQIILVSGILKNSFPYIILLSILKFGLLNKSVIENIENILFIVVIVQFISLIIMLMFSKKYMKFTFHLNLDWGLVYSFWEPNVLTSLIGSIFIFSQYNSLAILDDQSLSAFSLAYSLTSFLIIIQLIASAYNPVSLNLFKSGEIEEYLSINKLYNSIVVIVSFVLLILLIGFSEVYFIIINVNTLYYSEKMKIYMLLIAYSFSNSLAWFDFGHVTNKKYFILWGRLSSFVKIGGVILIYLLVALFNIFGLILSIVLISIINHLFMYITSPVKIKTKIIHVVYLYGFFVLIFFYYLILNNLNIFYSIPIGIFILLSDIKLYKPYIRMIKKMLVQYFS